MQLFIDLLYTQFLPLPSHTLSLHMSLLSYPPQTVTLVCTHTPQQIGGASGVVAVLVQTGKAVQVC